jgi:hemoglobin/transferrin/lactoferrin receptor protein
LKKITRREFVQKLKRALTVAVGLVSAVAANGWVRAEDQEPTVLKQVNVTSTATKTERAIFDTPDAVSVVDFTEMESRQVRSLGDALKDLPGVSIGGGPRALAQQPEIRGLSGNRVLITVDGARQNFNSGHKGRVFVDPELLKQIDVLRGPGSAVWGSGALGGVIAMTTKDAADFLIPDESWGARIRASGQSGDNETLGTGTLFGQLQEGKVEMLSGTRARSEDIRLGGGGILKNSSADLYASLAKIGWQPAPGHRLKVSRQYQFEAGEIPAQADAETSVTAVLTDRETESITQALSYTFDAPEHLWLNTYLNAYQTEQTIREKRIGTNGRLDVIGFTTDGIELRNTMDLSGRDSGTSSSSKHRLTYGLEYYRDRESSRQGAAVNAQFPEATAHFFGVFLQDEIDLTATPLGDWILVPGLRLDDYRSESEDLATTVVTATGIARDTAQKQWSPRLGAVYKLNPQTNLTASYSRAFRAPNFQELYISGAHFGASDFIPNPDLKPERGETVEFGVRHKRPSLWTDDDRLTLNGSIYWNRYRDFIETIVTPAATTMTNTGKARIYGAEGELNYHLSPLALDLGLSLTIARGDDQVQGDPLSTIAGDKMVFDAKRCFDRCNLSVSWRSSLHRRQTRVADGQPETPGYSVHDIYLTWRPMVAQLDDLQVNVGVSNLADHYYHRHLALLPDAGRSVNLSASVQF